MEETSFKVGKLNGDNYHSWKFNIKMYLIGKDLWEIVDGTEVVGENASEEEIKKFKKRENLALSLMCLSVTTNLQIYVRNAKTPKEVWNNLANHFEEKSLSRKIFYRRKMYSARMEKGSTMVEHVNNLKTISEHLEALEDVVVEKDLVMILISSLPEEYNNLITALETLKEEQLTWNYVRDRVLHEYERKKGDGKQIKEIQHKIQDALFVDNRKPQKKYQQGKQNWNNNNTTKFKCHYCHEKGHFQKDCPKRKSDFKKKGEAASMFCEERNKNRSNTNSEINQVEDKDLFYSEFALQVSSDDVNISEWWLDSGCSQHMTCLKEDFVVYEKFDIPIDVNLADKSIVPAIGSGDVNIIIFDNDREVPVSFKNVLYVPKLKKRLLSISEMTKTGAEVKFKGDLCSLIINQKKYEIGHKHGKLWKLNNIATCCFGCTDVNSLTLWHLRFGHLNNNDVKRLYSDKMVEGMSVDSKSLDEHCEGCALGKQSRYPFPKNSPKKTNDVLELVHSDVCGPMNIASVGGSLYFLTFKDDYSNFTWVYMLKKKSEVLEKFLEFLALAENFTGKRLKRIRTDNGGEYTSEEFIKYCKQRGVIKQLTIPYTPQQNGVAERLNRTIMENVRSMLYHSNLPLYLWAEAVATVVYLRNMSPTSSFKGETPYERWYGVKPNVDHLRIFGCNVYVHIPDEKRRKLDPKAFKGIFVGYPDGCKGYKIFVPETRRMYRSRDVKFLERSFRVESNKVGEQSGKQDEYNCKIPELNKIGDQSGKQDEYFCKEPESNKVNAQSGKQDEYFCCLDEDLGLDNIFQEEDKEIERIEEEKHDDIVQNLTRPLRNTRNPNRYGEWVAVAEVESEPKTYKQAIKGQHAEQWNKAMFEEISSLNSHQTWDLVDLPDGRNLVGCKWVYKTKYKANGQIDRFKARLVAQGYSQEAGVDYDEVFAPVARYTSIRSVLAIANQLDLEVHQMDVKSAFLNGELEDEIFMKQPSGFVDKRYPAKVCKLNKSLYGLKQSARCWNLMIDEYLKTSNYIQNKADPCVYYRTEVVDRKEIIMIIAVYVDDTIICSNNINMLNAEKERLSSRFEMDDRGELHFILGMEVNRDRKKRILTIDQKLYLKNVLKRFGMEDCKPVSTPIEPGTKFCKLTAGEEVIDETLYQAAVGSLNYAAIATRPDLSVAVGKLSQFMKNPGKEHWTGVKRVFRYIQGTLNHGLKFNHSDSFKLYGYSDADLAGCVDTRKSTSGHVFRIGDSTISWRSKKQPIVALSSTEAEYVALCAAAQETIWLRNLLKDINILQPGATTLYEDNQGAIALSKNPKNHPRTKHIDIKYHYVRETVENNFINLLYCPTADMLADVMTKGLPKYSFEKFRESMGVVNVDNVLNKSK